MPFDSFRHPVTFHKDCHELSQVVPAVVSTTVDRKSTRLNSSHVEISYAVFCLKKKTRMLISGASLLHHARFLPRQPISRRLNPCANDLHLLRDVPDDLTRALSSLDPATLHRAI